MAKHTFLPYCATRNLLGSGEAIATQPTDHRSSVECDAVERSSFLKSSSSGGFLPGKASGAVLGVKVTERLRPECLQPEQLQAEQVESAQLQLSAPSRILASLRGCRIASVALALAALFALVLPSTAWAIPSAKQKKKSGIGKPLSGRAITLRGKAAASRSKASAAAARSGAGKAKISASAGRLAAVRTKGGSALAAKSRTRAAGRYVRNKRGKLVWVASRSAGPSIVASGPWREPSFADSTLGDVIDGEDLVVRRAAVDALGPYNGSVVVVDPFTGRIMTIVNQKLAMQSAFQPCSTIKVVTGLAGLREGVIERNTFLPLSRYSSMNLTEALARSNNPFFAKVGQQVGFSKIHEYATMFGLGEKAGLNIDGEGAGQLTPEPPALGGVGMMTSFGEGIQMTPLQLASILSAVANGGTMYHLQYPRTQEAIENFKPSVKRVLPIQDHIDDILPGMMAAVEYGTGRRAGYEGAEPIYGKTGTCTDRKSPTHLGWFGSFNEVGKQKLVVVVLLTGGRSVNGPAAADVAGNLYKNLNANQYYASDRKTGMVGTVCCTN